MPKHGSLKWLLALGCAAIAAALVASHFLAQAEIRRYSGPPLMAAARAAAPGDQVPPLRLQDLAGDDVTLGRPSNRPTIVHFWASWCLPCVAELPAYQSAYPRLQSLGINFVSVALDDRNHAEGAIRKFGITFPVFLPEGGKANPAAAFGSSSGAVPYTVMLDAHGTIVAKKLGTAGGAPNILEWAQQATRR